MGNIKEQQAETYRSIIISYVGQKNKEEKLMNLTVPHMETIKATSKLTGLPEHFIRQKVLSGEIVSVKAGSKYLVNVDKFIEYLNTCTVETNGNDNETDCKISPVPVKL